MIGSGERRRKREWVACLIDLSLAVLHKLAVNQTAALSGSPVQRDNGVCWEMSPRSTLVYY